MENISVLCPPSWPKPSPPNCSGTGYGQRSRNTTPALGVNKQPSWREESYRELLGLPGRKETLFDYAEVVLLAPRFPNYLGQLEKILGWAGVCVCFGCVFLLVS